MGRRRCLELDNMLEKETPTPPPSIHRHILHSHARWTTLAYLFLAAPSPILVVQNLCGTTKVVNDFQRWSADFLLYLPAFIEKKNSPFLHTQHPRAALSTGNSSSSSIASKTRDARTQRLNSSSRDIGNKL